MAVDYTCFISGEFSSAIVAQAHTLTQASRFMYPVLSYRWKNFCFIRIDVRKDRSRVLFG